MKILFSIIAYLLCVCAFAQISSDSFEGSSIFTITNGGYKSGSSGASDGVASSPFSTVGSQGYGCNNATVTLISPVYDLSCYNNLSLSIDLSSFSLTSAANGADAADLVQIYISINGGGAYTKYLEVGGNSNAYWDYTAPNTATTAYPTVSTYAPAGGGNRTSTDGYSTLSISSLPSSATLVVKIVMLNNSANELWVIDNFLLQGSNTCNSITTGAVTGAPFNLASCAATASGTVAFTSSGTFSAGNVYTAYLSDASGNFNSPTNIGTLSSTANSGTINITIPAGTAAGTNYQIEIVSSNPLVTGTASSSFTITTSCVATLCPQITGITFNGCDNGATPCDEGQSEVIFGNSGSYAITVASLPTHVINYYGSSANYTAGSVNAYIGTFSAHASTTTSLNSMAGCSGTFIEAATVGTIPANSTFIMLPYDFCTTNYNLSAICGSFSPIYVLYYGTSTAGTANGQWSTSGNFANYQSGTKPKYFTADFTSVNAGCTKQYYTYDAGQQATGNGAGGAWATPVSTVSASPTSNYTYTPAGCSLPLVLPVDLISFTAKRVYTFEAELNFVTAKEENIKAFIISKSYDGIYYTKIAEEKGKNQSMQLRYLVYDRIEDESRPVVYYRLEEEDLNGVKKTVGTCLLELKPANEIVITVSGEELLVTTPAGIKSMELLAADGALISRVNGNESELLYKINMTAYSKGFYVLAITDNFGKVTVRKVIR